MSRCYAEGCIREPKVRGLCDMHYLRMLRHGDPLKKKKELSNKLDFRIDQNNCFNCTSHKVGTNGYPQVNHNKKPSTTHRKVYEVMFGDIPKGLVVRHKCDNKLCINPEHLELGTPKDNSRDMVERGGSTKGERNAKSKLKEKDVIEIKTLLSSNKVNRKLVLKISNDYGVNVNTIYDIYYNKTWTHVKVSGE